MFFRSITDEKFYVYDINEYQAITIEAFSKMQEKFASRLYYCLGVN